MPLDNPGAYVSWVQEALPFVGAGTAVLAGLSAAVGNSWLMDLVGVDPTGGWLFGGAMMAGGLSLLVRDLSLDR